MPQLQQKPLRQLMRASRFKSFCIPHRKNGRTICQSFSFQRLEIVSPGIRQVHQAGVDSPRPGVLPAGRPPDLRQRHQSPLPALPLEVRQGGKRGREVLILCTYLYILFGND